MADNTKLSLIPNVFASYGLTLLVSFILNIFIDIEYNIKNYIITNMMSLFIDLVFMYLLMNYLGTSIILSKIITALIILIISYIASKNKK